MNYEELTEIQDEFSYCESCKMNHSIGQGRLDATGMIIVPKPISLNKKFPSIYSSDSKEMDVLSMIFSKVDLHIDDWYITSTVTCPSSSLTKQDVLDSNERLKRILYTVSPKVVVLCGPQSYYAFFGKLMKGSYGPVECSNYEVFYNYDLTTYIKKKLEDPASCQDMAKTMFTVWTKISDILIQAKADTL